MMRRIALAGTLFVLWVLCVLSNGWTQSVGSVSITSPAEGATVQGPIIELDLTVNKGARGDGVNLYVDGRFESIVKGDRFLLKGLPAGLHRIDVRLATRNHEELGPAATITVTVE